MPYGKGPIKTGKGGKDKDKLKDKARKIISNPKKLGGKNLADLLGISDPSRKNVKGGKKLMNQYEAAQKSLKAPIKRGR